METNFSEVIVRALCQGSNHSNMAPWREINTMECSSSGEDRVRKPEPSDKRKDRSERLPSVKPVSLIPLRRRV